MKRPLVLAFCLAALVTVRAADVPLAIDKGQSRVEIMVKATVDSFTGTLSDYQSEIRIDRDTGRVLRAELTFHFSDVKTGKADRDEQMHHWQGTEKFPDGGFALGALTPEANGHFIATGQLTFHGVTREFSFPVTITTDRKLFALDGEAVIDTRQFGLPVIRKFVVLRVDPLVKVHFHLQGTAQNN